MIPDLYDAGMPVAWQRTVDPATLVWVRPDDAVAIGDDLVDLADGTTRDEPPWPFLHLQPWSRQLWEPRRTAVAEQGPDRLNADQVSARRWQNLLVAGRHTTDSVSGTGRGLLVEARYMGTRECAWRHRVSGAAETAAWTDWLAVTDDTVSLRSTLVGEHRDLLRHPDLESGGIRWAIPWRLDVARPVDDCGSGELIVLYDRDQPYVVGVDAQTGVPHWRFEVPDGGIPVAVRATERHVVVCAFPADLNRHLPYQSKSYNRRPVVLAAPPALTVTVHDRATGTPLWRHQWPWPSATGILAAGWGMTVAGEAVATQEDGWLHARRIADGASLWTRPLAELFTKSPVPPARRRIRLKFRGSTRRTEWMWLQQFHGSAGDGTATTADTIIQPLTGESVRLDDVIHISGDGLALTRSRDALTCLTLFS